MSRTVYTPPSVISTKGDLWGFSTKDLPLPVGTDGKVVTADSTTALGLAYKTPASGLPAGSDTQVQFNDGGVFGASSKFTYDKTNVILVVGEQGVALGIIKLKGTGSGNNAGTIYGGTSNNASLRLLGTTAGISGQSNAGRTEIGDSDNFMDQGNVNTIWQMYAARGSNILDIIGDVGIGNPPAVTIQYYGGTVNPFVNPTLIFQRAKGTKASPTLNNAAGTNYGTIAVQGWDGTAWRQCATITFAGEGTPGASDVGCEIAFATTPDGSITQANAMVMRGNGSIEIPTSGIVLGAAPSGGDKGIGTINAAGKYYADGTAGVSAGPFTAITGITVKNGLVTALTGS